MILFRSFSGAFILLSVILHQGVAQDCEDTETWCPDNDQFCKTVPSLLEICPFTCNSCKPSACDVCEQKCTVKSDGGVQCSCLKGYELASDGATCKDVDECLDSPCKDPDAPKCENFDGGYTCTESECTKFQTQGYVSFYDRPGCCKKTSETCGKNVQNKKGRIINGTDAVVKLWPWMALIVLPNNLCGGSLINTKWVVSAAHCFRGVTNTRGIKVYLGVYDSNDLLASSVQKRSIAQLISHPKFDFPEYDVAVLKLNKQVKLGDHVSPVCLPNGNVPPVGTKCYATGFGVTVVGGLPSRILQQVDLPIVDGEVCKKAYKNEQDINTERMICAGYTEGGKDACRGDSGGPLVCQRCDNCDWYLAGITSFGQGCAKPNFYGVYANVEYFERWIEKNTKNIVVTKGTCRPIEWSNWADWGQCSKKCDGGTQSRIRFCLNGKMGLPGCLGSDIDTRTCNEDPCGKKIKFGPWSSCSVTCGKGKQTRVSICNVPGCKTEEQTKDCTMQECPKWGKWSKWTDCSVTCGGGTKIRLRVCRRGGVEKSGCPGPGSETDTCGAVKCPYWEEWSAWSKCTKTCGKGIHTSIRKCIGGIPSIHCAGQESRTKDCKIIPCEVPHGPWSRWGDCSASCGPATQTRSRECPSGACIADEFGKALTENRPCLTKPCPVPFDPWGKWEDCPVTCGGSVQTRSRICPTKLPCITDEFGSSLTDTRLCGVDKCPYWEEWQPWRSCSKTCGGGFQFRRRKCIGKGSCDGSETDVQECNAQRCIGKWSEWKPWGECSKSCETGSRERFRICENGVNCPGKGRESEDCNTMECPHWTEWMEWGACSKECGSGERERARTCMRGLIPDDSCEGNSTQTEICNTNRCIAPCSDYCRLNVLPLGYCSVNKPFMDQYCPDCCEYHCEDQNPSCVLYFLDYCPTHLFSQCLRSCGYCADRPT